MADKLNGHGGSRSGAGRPRGEAGIVKANAFVAKKARGLAEDGIEVLAESYPDLMRAAIAMAMGDGDKKLPSIPMLKTLVEMLPRLTQAETEESETEVAILIRKHLGRVSTEVLDV